MGRAPSCPYRVLRKVFKPTKNDLTVVKSGRWDVHPHALTGCFARCSNPQKNDLAVVKSGRWDVHPARVFKPTKKRPCGREERAMGFEPTNISLEG